mmetsp:Transcript_19336/g.36300  ORF Transcript_19336/g.36300 Transcript_19336/m.36300 type:complete len:221 (-) Transcript_19336:314-976(-)
MAAALEHGGSLLLVVFGGGHGSALAQESDGLRFAPLLGDVDGRLSIDVLDVCRRTLCDQDSQALRAAGAGRHVQGSLPLPVDGVDDEHVGLPVSGLQHQQHDLHVVGAHGAHERCLPTAICRRHLRACIQELLDSSHGLLGPLLHQQRCQMKKCAVAARIGRDEAVHCGAGLGSVQVNQGASKHSTDQVRRAMQRPSDVRGFGTTHCQDASRGYLPRPKR